MINFKKFALLSALATASLVLMPACARECCKSERTSCKCTNCGMKCECGKRCECGEMCRKKMKHKKGKKQKKERRQKKMKRAEQEGEYK